MIEIVPLDVIDAPQVEGLLDRAFGAGRRQRTAYRIRTGMAELAGLSFAALREGGTLAGTIQCWPVALACDSGRVVPLVMVGPVAVEPELQQAGIGQALMRHMLDAVDGSDIAGSGALMLIGDPEYYGRFFGFTADRTGGWRLPGPFERRRLLARGTCVPDCAGELGPRVLKAAA